MLSKRQRLTKRMIEETMIRAPRLRTARFLVIYTRLNDGLPPAASITVSKKIAPSAVVRNRLRRRGYAAMAHIMENIKLGSKILISYTVCDTQTSVPILAQELKDALEKAKVLI